MSAFVDYLTELQKNLAHGDSTEHTHRPALKNLLQSVGQRPARVDQRHAILWRRAESSLGISRRRLSGLRKVAKRPQRPQAHLRRHSALPEDRRGLERNHSFDDRNR